MPFRRHILSSLTRALCLAAAACNVHVSYEGTGYTCDPPDGDCPPGFVCTLAGRCDLPDGLGVDAAIPDATSGAPDADIAGAVPWWDDRWPFRRKVTVRNVSGTRLSGGFQARLLFDLDLLAEVATTGFDTMHLQHYDPGFDPWYEMPRIAFDLPGSDEEMFFRLEESLDPGESINHYYLYYGNATPPAPLDDPDMVFDFFASFQAFDGSIITLTGGETVLGGELRLDPGESVRSAPDFPAGTAVDVALRLPTWTFRVWAGFQRKDDFLDDEPWMLWATRLIAPNMIAPEAQSTAAGVPTIFIGTPVAAGTSEHTLTVERYPQEVIFKRDGVVSDRLALPTMFLENMQVRLYDDGQQPAFFDFIRVREARDPMPEVTLGPEETRP